MSKHLSRAYWIGPRGTIYFTLSDYLAALDAARAG